MPVTSIYLALGSNLGDRRANLRAALEALPPAARLRAASPVYETPPWGIADQPPFLNMAAEAETSLAPEALLAHLKDAERRLGRLPAPRWGPRLIDLDLLFYGDLVCETPALTIPHPRLHERAFVLVPLADLAPDLVHPALGRTVRQMLAEVDASGVKRYDE